MEQKSKNCDICDTNATSLCFQCANYFCERCYKFIHDNKKNSNHIKEKIDPFIPIELKCPEHPTIPNNLFCCEEKVKSKNIFI